MKRAAEWCRNSGSLRSVLPFAFLFSITVILSSCLSYEQVVLHDIKDISISSMDAGSVALSVEAVIENPNGYRIRAMDPDVDLFLNGNFIGKGLLDSAIVLEPRSTNTYIIPLHAEFKGGSLLMTLLSGALSGDMELTASGTVLGRAGLLRKRFPFELKENFDLRGSGP